MYKNMKTWLVYKTPKDFIVLRRGEEGKNKKIRKKQITDIFK